MRLTKRTLLFSLLLTAACGVSESEEGDLAANKTGSIMTSLALREAPDAELLARCGAGSLSAVGSASLRRGPFMQQVTSDGALVVLNPNSALPVEVDVTTFDGVRVATVTSEPDPSVAGGVQQIAHIQGLQPSTGYCYTLRDMTAAAGFRTASAPGAGARVRFAALGDSGKGGTDQLALLAQMQTTAFDFILHTGDLAYEDGTAEQLERTVFQVYAPLMRSIPFYPIAGNHEYHTDDAAPFLNAFVLPDNAPAGLAERWYSFDWGDVHFVGLDTEQIGAVQTKWLEADLSRNRLPWTVVFAHRPPYSSGEHGSDRDFRQYFVPLLERFQVPLVLNGHDHNYERSKVVNGVTYVVTGGGGFGTRPVGESSFTAFSEAVVHFVVVEVEGNRLVLHAIDGVGREFDQTVIEREAE